MYNPNSFYNYQTPNGNSYNTERYPVPAGALKESNEQYGYPFYQSEVPLKSYDYFSPYGFNDPGIQRDIFYADTPFYNNGIVYPGYAPRFFSSVDSFAPFPEVKSNWEKIGIIKTVSDMDDTIMNLYRRPIAPLQDLFEYSVQDKDGFVVPLKVNNILETGDIIESVIGKESKGKWKVEIFVNDKWIWA